MICKLPPLSEQPLLLIDGVVRRDDDTYRRESDCVANENEDLALEEFHYFE
jgi:hypothetical protein